jgi:hypothetical protein
MSSEMKFGENKRGNEIAASIERFFPSSCQCLHMSREERIGCVVATRELFPLRKSSFLLKGRT